MTYQDEAQTIAEQTSAQVLAVLAAYVAGQVGYEAATALVAAFITAGNIAATTLGDVSLAAAVTLSTGIPAAPIGISRPDNDPERLNRAAQTILNDLDRQTRSVPRDDLDPAISTAQKRFLRLAEAEIRQAAAAAYDEAVKASEAVVGWTRGLEPEACQLCTWWWREGRVWAPEHPFQHHTGCDCSQVIVTRKEAS